MTCALTSELYDRLTVMKGSKFQAKYTTYTTRNFAGRTHMDTTTLLIIVLLVLLLGGGGWYGRGRWY